ncbi:hypothetical protein M231_03662 [Tremella mesenterica]|uniref:Uncharacterized protein n=1 Tax=Tremella mesenterica TaxID=5217 RepID=A0A4Q1BMH9_TREME|nr:hypothetical protein M231_03662 [Tremella mesenterica]
MNSENMEMWIRDAKAGGKDYELRENTEDSWHLLSKTVIIQDTNGHGTFALMYAPQSKYLTDDYNDRVSRLVPELIRELHNKGSNQDVLKRVLTQFPPDKEHLTIAHASHHLRDDENSHHSYHESKFSCRYALFISKAESEPTEWLVAEEPTEDLKDLVTKLYGGCQETFNDIYNCLVVDGRYNNDQQLYSLKVFRKTREQLEIDLQSSENGSLLKLPKDVTE